MKTRYLALLIGMIILCTTPSSYSQENDSFDDRETPGSYAGVEVGPTYILNDGGSGASNLLSIYFNFGFTLNKLFGLTWENQNFTLGPKIGLNFGEPSATADKTMFYDIIANFRYTPGNGENIFRPYLEAGPGLGNYTGAALHVDVGAGLGIFYNDQDSIGLSAHYNQYFTGLVEQTATFLATLSHHW
jgi:hypothetical protein